MAAYRLDDLKVPYRLTACTPGSARGPAQVQHLTLRYCATAGVNDSNTLAVCWTAEFTAASPASATVDTGNEPGLVDIITDEKLVGYITGNEGDDDEEGLFVCCWW